MKPLASGMLGLLDDDAGASFDRRRTVPQRHAASVQLDRGFSVLAMHEPHGLVEYAAEIPYTVVVPSELSLESRPRHQDRLSGIDSVQTLCKPGIHVQAHR